jgi:hypothetical protein
MIFGLETSEAELPEGWTPLEAVAVLKCLDEEGNVAFCVRSTEALSDMEAYALLSVTASLQKREIIAGFEDG